MITSVRGVGEDRVALLLSVALWVSTVHGLYVFQPESISFRLLLPLVLFFTKLIITILYDLSSELYPGALV